ncbi:ribonuclease H-like domain-containing protein [Tanacetum coccineum]
MAGSDDEILPPPPPQTSTQQAPHTVSTIKLHILKKGEYDIWAMKMEHYLSHTNYPIWEVIQKGNGPISVSTDTNEVIKVLPPKTTKEILARERERKARATFLMALPEDHLTKFHKITDAKDTWDAIKSRFGGNDESKKMQKYILKQQFEGFSLSNSEGLYKGYDRFQSLLSQLDIHGVGVSTEDANQKFLRSLTSSWSQVSLVMRTNPGVGSLSFDDLYNNLRVFKFDVKGFTRSSSSTQNVAFVSSESTSSTNVVSTAYGVSTSSGYNSQRENSPSYTDELMYSFFANQSVGEGCNLMPRNQLVLTRPRLSASITITQGTLLENADQKEIKKAEEEMQGTQEEPKALVTLDGEGVDWTGHAEDEQENFALMAYNNSGSDTEVTSCSKECVESYAKLKKLYDEQKEQLGDASIDIQAYTQALKKVEAQLVTHQKNQLWYEEKIRFMKINLDDKTDVLTYHKKLLAEAVKEKEELKTKLENFQSSSKGLSKLLNSQMSKRDKSGLGYGDQAHNGVLSYENEVFQSVFDSRLSDVEDSPVNDRFAKVEGMHVVPLPMTGIYMPSKSDFRIDDSKFTYGPKQSKTSESDAKTSDTASCESNSSVETSDSVPKLAVNEPITVSKSKVWSDAPIIEEYKSDSDDEYVIEPSKEQEKPSFAFVNTVWDMVSLKRHALYVNKKKGKGTGQGENRPVWNNVQRLNHQNKFVPTAVLTRTGRIPVNTARQNLSSQAATTSTARKVNTARPIVNEIRPRNNFYKSHSPIRRPFNRTTAPRTNFSNHKVNTAGVKAVSVVGGIRETAVKPSAGCNWRPKRHYWNKVSKYNGGSNSRKCDNPQRALKNKGIVDSGCSRHMTGNKAYLAEYQDYNGGPVAFGGSKGYITGKGKIKTGKLDFEDVCFVKELQHFNLFSVSQMCDKKNKVLFTDTECLVLSSDFKLPDENQVLLRIPRQNNMYSFNLENIVPSGGLACLIAKATVDESNKWHRRLGHVNFKNLNKLVKGNLPVRSSIKLTETAGQEETNHSAEKEYAQDTKDFLLQAGDARAASTNTVNTASTLNPKFPKKVYKVVKALYGLHQAPRAWYATLSTFLLKSGYRRGTIDKTFFIKKDKNDIMLVQVYMDDIIFGSTKRSWCDEFEALMNSRFQMSSMGELTFFLGLQVKQKEYGFFISQDKYVAEILKKFDFASVKTASTPIETQKSLTKDEEAADVDVHLYRSMIGSLMYLTASRPDIMYLKGKPKLGLWYPRVSSFNLESYSDSDYAGENLDRKSTTGVNTVGQLNTFATKPCIVPTAREEEIAGSVDVLHQELASPEQTASGKDFLNPLIVDSLLKTIWFINAPCFCNEALAIPGQTATGKELSIEMADKITKKLLSTSYRNNLNLSKANWRSEIFHQIVDFLAGSHIKYALTTNPTIYVSLVEQFWEIATVETLNDGEQQISVTVDGHKLAITEASVRRHLQ